MLLFFAPLTKTPHTRVADGVAAAEDFLWSLTQAGHARSVRSDLTQVRPHCGHLMQMKLAGISEDTCREIIEESLQLPLQ